MRRRKISYSTGVAAVLAAFLIGGGTAANAAVTTGIDPGGAGQAHADAPSAEVSSVVAAVAPPPGYSVHGIDVSHYQGSINWASVANAGIDFAYAKVTEGTSFVDQTFATNYAGAKAQGIYSGAYHFGRPDLGSPTTQANYFIDHASFTRDGRTLPPMLDIETGTTVGKDTCYGLSTSAMGSWISGFVNQVRARTGSATTIYTASGFWNQCTGGSSAFNSNPLFAARWSSTVTPLPTGWSTWTLWQYTSSGSVPGISGNVDGDVFNGSLAQLAVLAGGGNPIRDHVSDVSGDGHADILATKPDGTLWYYPNNSDSNPGGVPFTTGTQIGTGWQVFTTVSTADISGDGHADLVATKPDGTLWYYPNNSDSNPGHIPFTTGTQIGTGWEVFNWVHAADISGDGHADILATKPDGTLWYYPNNSDSNPGHVPFISGTQIGTGWETYDRVF
jgi:GH25 family lysozyme M1 (1,4-beta-N-acetylmuramidase)